MQFNLNLILGVGMCVCMYEVASIKQGTRVRTTEEYKLLNAYRERRNETGSIRAQEFYIRKLCQSEIHRNEEYWNKRRHPFH